MAAISRCMLLRLLRNYYLFDTKIVPVLPLWRPFPARAIPWRRLFTLFVP